MEAASDEHNHSAVLRTCDAFGVQTAHIVIPKPGLRSKMRRSGVGGGDGDGDDALSRRVMLGAAKWLDIHTYASTTDCIVALRAQGYSLWATDLSPEAVLLDRSALRPLDDAGAPLSADGAAAAAGPADARVQLALPPRLAIVFGREVDGVSPAMLAAADRRFFLPMVGFSESFNVSVAAALTLQRVFDLWPHARGHMSEARRKALRVKWYAAMVSGPSVEELYRPWLHVAEAGGSVEPLPDLRRAPEEKESVLKFSDRLRGTDAFVEDQRDRNGLLMGEAGAGVGAGADAGADAGAKRVAAGAADAATEQAAKRARADGDRT
jgi:tRNA G18 (ribose-2'-O)-methylase SpoU